MTSHFTIAKALISRITLKKRIMYSTLTPKTLFKNYIKTEGWRNLTINSKSFLFTFTIFLLFVISYFLGKIFDTPITPLVFTFLQSFHITGFIATISILMIIIAGFAIIGSIMEKEFLYATKKTGVLDVFYFVFFWDALLAGSASLLWILFGFLLNVDFYPLQVLIGIIALLITIYAICFTISMVLSITKLIDFKTDYTETIIEIDKNLKSPKK